MLTHWIWLATRPNFHDRDKIALLAHFNDPEDLYYADAEGLKAVEGLSAEQQAALQDKNLTQAEEIVSQCAAKKIGILTYGDAAYPRKLKNITDPPLVLYYKGHLPDLEGSPVIGVVGTRKASGYGLTVAKRMGYQIAACGGVVASGMAWGIDGMAMAGALSAGQPVVGVLGCGVDIVYPQSNRNLFKDMEKGGCLISEFVPGTPPYKWNFPKRNRIISGISNGVLIIEAPERSGSLITANQAAEQGRDVFVVPGNIDVPTCIGSNALLRDGAISVTTGWDVVGEYESQYPGRVQKVMTAGKQPSAQEAAVQPQEEPAPPRKKNPTKPKKDKKVIDKAAPAAYSDLNDRIDGLTEEQRAVFALVTTKERLVDDIVAEAGLPTGKILAILTLLELKGLVTRLPGKRVTRRR